jgi:hypothetical protein
LTAHWRGTDRPSPSTRGTTTPGRLHECVCVWLCVCVCEYGARIKHLYIGLSHTHTHIYIYIYSRIHIFIFVSTHTHTHTYIHTYACMHSGMAWAPSTRATRSTRWLNTICGGQLISMAEAVCCVASWVRGCSVQCSVCQYSV